MKKTNLENYNKNKYKKFYDLYLNTKNLSPITLQIAINVYSKYYNKNISIIKINELENLCNYIYYLFLNIPEYTEIDTCLTDINIFLSHHTTKQLLNIKTYDFFDKYSILNQNNNN